MRMRAGLVCLFYGLLASLLCAQTPTPKPATSPKAKKKEKAAASGTEAPASNKLLGDTKTTGPITTEIFADNAFFDSAKSMGVFSGRVKVNDPRFNLQSDKLTVFISKGENQGLEKAVAEGSVGVVRDRPDPNGGPPTRAIGRSEKATYISATGDVELTGMPRVQQGLNTHVASSPETVMVINQNGQLTTHGPSRTEIRQEPKDEGDGEKKEGDGEKKEKKGEKKKEAAEKHD
jgi:lipopolysaccharide transport protein LptA